MSQFRSESLKHEIAWKAATDAITKIPALTDEQRKAAFAEVYNVIKVWLGEYETRADRAEKRLHPLPSVN